MTGYGKAEALLPSGKLTVEIRTLNGKSADISIKSSLLPKDKDLAIRQKIADALVRGTIDVYISFEAAAAENARIIDAELVKEKYDLSCELTFALVTSKSASYSNKVTIIDSKGVARDKVVDVLNKLSGTSTGFKVTVNGIVSEANNLRYE